MSVEKFIVTKEDSNYTILPNKVLQGLQKHSTALGVWCSLISLPPQWEFHKDTIYSDFNIGRDKLKKIFDILEMCNLITITQGRSDQGKFGYWELHIKNGAEFIPFTENTSTADNRLLKNRHTVNQSLVNSTYKRNIKKETQKEKKMVGLPEWLSVQDWNDFTEHRKHIKAPLSDNAIKRLLTTLQKLKDSGANISDVINQSIVNGWKGLFPIRNQTATGNSHANKRKSNAAIHFDSCKRSLKGTVYDSEYKSNQDPFSA